MNGELLPRRCAVDCTDEHHVRKVHRILDDDVQRVHVRTWLKSPRSSIEVWFYFCDMEPGGMS
jgi:hypothetical protein